MSLWLDSLVSSCDEGVNMDDAGVGQLAELWPKLKIMPPSLVSELRVSFHCRKRVLTVFSIYGPSNPILPVATKWVGDGEGPLFLKTSKAEK